MRKGDSPPACPSSLHWGRVRSCWHWAGACTASDGCQDGCGLLQRAERVGERSAEVSLSWCPARGRGRLDHRMEGESPPTDTLERYRRAATLRIRVYKTWRTIVRWPQGELDTQLELDIFGLNIFPGPSISDITGIPEPTPESLEHWTAAHPRKARFLDSSIRLSELGVRSFAVRIDVDLVLVESLQLLLQRTSSYRRDR